jgi:hypothetical protein
MKIEPNIHRTQENWSAIFRENLSATKDETREPTRLPAGMEAVMAP